jgi:hypothetical protein
MRLLLPVRQLKWRKTGLASLVDEICLFCCAVRWFAVAGLLQVIAQ